MAYIAICNAGKTSELHRAAQLYERFHCFPARSINRVRWHQRVPRMIVDLGELRALVYRSDRGRKGRPQTYIHFMETPPRLACDAWGKQLFILGGRYRVTERGIEG